MLQIFSNGQKNVPIIFAHVAKLSMPRVKVAPGILGLRWRMLSIGHIPSHPRVMRLPCFKWLGYRVNAEHTSKAVPENEHTDVVLIHYYCLAFAKLAKNKRSWCLNDPADQI